jgi:hypothetical protein
MTLYGILAPIIRGYRTRRKAGERGGARFGFQRQNLNPDTYSAFAVLAMFATSLYIAAAWEFGARLVPQTIGVAGVLLTGALIASRLFIAPVATTPVMAAGEDDGGEVDKVAAAAAGGAFKTSQEEVHFDIQADYGDLDLRTIFIRAATYFGWLLFFFAAAAIIGLLPAMFLFLVGYMRFEGRESWAMTLGIAVPMWIASYGLFHKILLVPWAPALVGNLFPWLRDNEWLNIL